LTPSISITPSVTPSSTPPPNIIYWSFSTGGGTGVSFSIVRNSTTEVSRTTSGAGSFSYTSGDTIFVQTTENVKNSDWTQTCTYVYGGALLYSDKVQDGTSSNTFTTSAGEYNVTGQQSTSEMPACMSPEA
jgi:hypothetical protein